MAQVFHQPLSLKGIVIYQSGNKIILWKHCEHYCLTAHTTSSVLIRLEYSKKGWTDGEISQE